MNAARKCHKASVCKKKKYQKSKKINIVLFKKVNSNGKRKYVDVKINGQTINSLLDTGSVISVMDELTWKKIVFHNFGRPKKIARGVSGSKLKYKEEFYANVSFSYKMHEAKVCHFWKKLKPVFGWIILFNS